MAKADLTAQRLRELLHYDAETGQLVWKVFRGRKAKPGSVAGALTSQGYIDVMISGCTYKAHRIVWAIVNGDWPRGVIDHIDGHRNNNRISNLRDVSLSVNKQNTKRARCDSKASGLIGAFWHNRSNRWFSNIGVNGKRIHLGMFATAEEAHAAYIEAKRRLHAGCTI